MVSLARAATSIPEEDSRFHILNGAQCEIKDSVGVDVGMRSLSESLDNNARLARTGIILRWVGNWRCVFMQDGAVEVGHPGGGVIGMPLISMMLGFGNLWD